MKNHKQLLMDFYLELLAISPLDRFRALNPSLYGVVLHTLAKELNEEAETIQTIFERMVQEDK